MTTAMSTSHVPAKNTFVPRITQLDAIEFDNEIKSLLINQLLEVSMYLKPGCLSGVMSEIKLLINILLHRYSLGKSNATFGQQLLNVKYGEKFTPTISTIFSLFNYGIPYITEKYEESFNEVSKNVKKIIDASQAVVKLCQLVNFLVFLRQGSYPTLIDRILKLEYIPLNSLHRSVGYSYMTRELLWHGFMELLMFTLPLVNYQTLKRHLKSLVQPQKKMNVKELQPVEHNLSTTCVVCQNVPTMPCRISVYCPHLGCYYCITANVLADEKFKCPECNQENTATEHIQFIYG